MADPADDPIIVHFPSGGGLKKVARRKGYATACSKFVHPPRGIRVERDDRGEYLVAEPHERYHVWCSRCADLVPADLRPVEGRDWKGDPLATAPA